jgi:hypothetical protein
MNALTVQPQYADKLPDFLRVPDLFGTSAAFTGGIASSSPPQVGIAGAKWTLIEANGDKLFVQQMHLDVIAIGANPYMSKAYYTTKFDPNDPTPPDCFSDNGKGASSQASNPQSTTCQLCQWNAFGSKISETGSEIKACGDLKKIAVVLAAPTQCVINGATQIVQPFEQIYLLRLPITSIRQPKKLQAPTQGKPWKDYVSDIDKARLPMAGVITRMLFDPVANYPKIIFSPIAIVPDAATFARYSALIGSTDMEEIVGATDVPFAGNQQQTMPETQFAPAAALPLPSSPPPSVTSPQATATPPAGFATTASPTEQPRPRGRPRAGAQPAPAPVQQMANPLPPQQDAFNQQAPAPQQNGAIQQMANPLPPQQDAFNQQAAPQQNGAIQQATAASPDLDALLAKTFG